MLARPPDWSEEGERQPLPWQIASEGFGGGPRAPFADRAGPVLVARCGLPATSDGSRASVLEARCVPAVAPGPRSGGGPLSARRLPSDEFSVAQVGCALQHRGCRGSEQLSVSWIGASFPLDRTRLLIDASLPPPVPDWGGETAFIALSLLNTWRACFCVGRSLAPSVFCVGTMHGVVHTGPCLSIACLTGCR